MICPKDLLFRYISCLQGASPTSSYETQKKADPSVDLLCLGFGAMDLAFGNRKENYPSKALAWHWRRQIPCEQHLQLAMQGLALLLLLSASWQQHSRCALYPHWPLKGCCRFILPLLLDIYCPRVCGGADCWALDVTRWQ